MCPKAFVASHMVTSVMDSMVAKAATFVRSQAHSCSLRRFSSRIEDDEKHHVPTSLRSPSCYLPVVQMEEFLEEEFNVLVIGAGGLGCELLKDLALCAVSDITVIDMDSIDVSNLNRYAWRVGWLPAAHEGL